jgi:hypothetical protein
MGEGSEEKKKTMNLNLCVCGSEERGHGEVTGVYDTLTAFIPIHYTFL